MPLRLRWPPWRRSHRPARAPDTAHTGGVHRTDAPRLPHDSGSYAAPIRVSDGRPTQDGRTMVRFPSENEQGSGPGPDEVAPVASLADRRSRRAAARPPAQLTGGVEEPADPPVAAGHPARGRTVTEVDGIVTIGTAVDESEAGRALAARERIAEAPADAAPAPVAAVAPKSSARKSA